MEAAAECWERGRATSSSSWIQSRVEDQGDLRRRRWRRSRSPDPDSEHVGVRDCDHHGQQYGRARAPAAVKFQVRFVLCDEYFPTNSPNMCWLVLVLLLPLFHHVLLLVVGLRTVSSRHTTVTTQSIFMSSDPVQSRSRNGRSKIGVFESNSFDCRFLSFFILFD